MKPEENYGKFAIFNSKLCLKLVENPEKPVETKIVVFVGKTHQSLAGKIDIN
jgi:hypothetical protein